jgi:hypothetical protein
VTLRRVLGGAFVIGALLPMASAGAVPTKPPTAAAVAQALGSGGIPLAYPVTDVTRFATKAGPTTARYEAKRVRSQAETATNDYDIEVTVYKSQKARQEVEAFHAKNLTKADLDPSIMPLNASTGCGAIGVDLDDAAQKFDPSVAIPKVNEILARQFGPC